jgi:flagellar basal body-associated protein FliL
MTFDKWPIADSQSGPFPGSPRSAEAGPEKQKRRRLRFWGSLLAGLSVVFLFTPKQEKHTYSHVDNNGSHELASGESKSGPEAKNQSGTETKRMSVPLNKLSVPIAGTLGKRYLLASVTVVGSGGETFKAKIKEHDAQLRDLAMGTLATNTLADLEKPGARKVIRTELINGFNTMIGDNSVEELYITEFGIQ